MRSLKTSPLALLAIIGPLALSCVLPASAQDAQVATPPPSIRCAEEHPISVTLPPSFERIPSQNPAVLCVFRNKNGGFPTFNIVVEPRHEGSQPPTLEQYIEGITKGYATVGLEDARLSNSETGEIEGIPFFSSDVRFTSNGTPMAARILVLQLYDRTYTASAIHRADAADFSPTLLSSLTEGITIEGVSSPAGHAKAPSYAALILGFVGCIIVVLIGVRLLKKTGASAR